MCFARGMGISRVSVSLLNPESIPLYLYAFLSIFISVYLFAHNLPRWCVRYLFYNLGFSFYLNVQLKNPGSLTHSQFPCSDVFLQNAYTHFCRMYTPNIFAKTALLTHIITAYLIFFIPPRRCCCTMLYNTKPTLPRKQYNPTKKKTAEKQKIVFIIKYILCKCCFICPWILRDNDL